MSGLAIENGTLGCLVCDGANPEGQALCQHCAAPMSLTYATRASGRPPCFVPVLGDANVGKTVYLGFLLDLLSQRSTRFEATPVGPYSVNLPQTVINHMSQRCFPPKTPVESNQWNWSYYEIQDGAGRQQRVVDLLTPDLPGEAIAAEIDSPQTFYLIQNLLAKSAACMVMVDAALAANGSSQPDFFAMKVLSYIENYMPQRRGRKVDAPVAIVLTKGDYVPECFDDVEGFAQANLNRLWSLVDRRFARARFFPTSVVGALGFAAREGDDVVTAVPLHTALRGVLEPFEWIVDQL